MTSKPPSKAYRPTKTLFTPVLYGSSQAGPSSASKQPATSNYLTFLSCTHIALAHTVQEVPSSRCGSPVDGEEPPVDKESEARVEELRKRVVAAQEAADWNPTDGNWAMLSQILHMSVTGGRYRWMGARADGELSEPGINAGTESEWVEWERRRAEEDRLKRKIENWKKTVDVDHVDPTPPDTIKSISMSRESLTRVENVQGAVQDKPVDVALREDLKAASAQAKLHDPLLARSGLGFSVVKRNSQALTGKPKPTPRTHDSDNAVPRVGALFKPEDHNAAQQRDLQEDTGSSKLPSNSENARHVQVLSHSRPDQPDDSEASIPPKNQPTRTVQSIANILETSFLPPSFPSSQMITSTPKRNQNPERCRQKPAPIPSAPPATPLSTITPPTASPLLNKAQGQPRTSQSLPALPTTPIGPNGNQTHKRPVSPTSPIGRPAKKARTVPMLPSSDIPVSNTTPPDSSSPIAPTTPISSDKNRIILDTSPPAASLGLATPKRRPLPTLTELLASSRKAKKLGSPNRKPKSKSPMRVAAEQFKIKADAPNNANAFNHAQGHTGRITAKAGRFPSPLDNPFMLDPYALSAHHDELEPDARASPTKSLSSIAGSDSDPDDEDDEERGTGGGFAFDPDDEFDPPFQSTQQGDNHGKQHKFGGWMGYNSQFDVDGQVSQVDKLLEKDVQVDYDGWLRDPSNEPPEVSLDSSP